MNACFGGLGCSSYRLNPVCLQSNSVGYVFLAASRGSLSSAWSLHPKQARIAKTPPGIGDGLSSPELGPFFATSQINANLMGSADCEGTIRIVPIAALYPTSTLASALPGWGRSLPGLWNES